MEGKKKYFALVLFLFLGLMIFTFANPVEEEKEFIDGDNEQSEKVESNKDKNNQDNQTTTLDENETTEGQQNIQNNVTNNTNNTNNNNNNNNNNNGNTQNREEDHLGKALAAVEKAEASYSKEDVETAKELVNNVTDPTEKGKLQNRLDEVEAGIAVLELLEQLEKQVEEATEKTDMTEAKDFRDENEIAEKIAALTNETVAKELQKRLEEVSKLLDDNKAPVINVEEKAYQENVKVSAVDEEGNDFTLYLTKDSEEEKEIENNTSTTSEGIYVARAIDEAFNESAPVRFIVDWTDPVFKNLTNGGHYKEVIIEVEDLSKVVIKVTNMDKNETSEVENGAKLTEEATYKLEAEDEAGNKTTYWVAIDNTRPTISTTDNSFINYTKWTEVKDKFLTLVKIKREAPNGEVTEETFTRANFEVGARNENFKFRYKLKEEGKYTIYAEDKYGNYKQETVTVDKTAAKAHAVNINVNGYKNDIKEQYATNGNTISAYISINEELKHNPTFTFFANGKEIKVMKDEVVKSNSTNPEYPHVYTATLEINEELVAEDGLVTFTVTDIVDKAGNKTADLTKTTTNKVITLDRTAAARVYSTIRSKATAVVQENKKDIDYYHKNGTEFEYAISFNELLKEAPTVTIAGRNLEMKLNEKVFNNENKFLYEGTFKIAEDEAELVEGILEIKVTNIKDLAGNETTLGDQTKTSNGRRVIYDRTPATIKSADFYVSGLTQIEKTFYTQYGKKIVANITTDEELGQNPTFTLHNNGKDYVVEDVIYRGLNDKGYHLYQASYELTKETGMTDGEITFTASNIKDLAGNTTTDVTAPTNGRRIVLDNVLKIDKLAIIGKNGQWKDKDYIQYANTGTTVYVNARFKEELATTPVVKLNDKVELTKATKKESNGIWIYSYSYKLTENDGLEDGSIQVKVTNIKDFAGNTAELTNEHMTMESQSEVVVDRTLPTFRFTKAGSSLVKDEITPIEKDGVYYFNQYVRVTLSDSVNLRLHGVDTYYDDKNAKRTGWLTDVKTEGEHTAVAVDAAGNRLEFKFVIDATAPEIQLPGTAGKNKNEMIVESGTKVSLEDVMAKVVDNIDGEWTIKPYKADLLIGTKEENIYNYDFSNGFNTNYAGRYNIYYKTKDSVGNETTKTMLLVMKDTTPAEIIIPGTEGNDKNQYRILQNSHIKLEYVTGKYIDSVDGEGEIIPTEIYKFYPSSIGTPAHKYTLEERIVDDKTEKYFDTSIVGLNYTIKYEYKDSSNNISTKTMILIVDAPHKTEIVNNEINLNYDLILNDKPFYNDMTRTEDLTINGNGKTITQEIDTTYKYTWDITGTRPLQSNMFSSENGSTITINDLNFAGSMYSMTLGHYRSKNQGGFNTILNNVNMINTKVASFSAGLSPAMTIYGRAVLNNVNVYGTTLSELDTDPMWPVYDIAMVNNTNTTINGGKIGTIYTWPKSYLEINNAEVDTITTQIEYRSDYKNAALVIGDNTKVNKVVLTEDKAVLTIKATASVDTLDISAHDEKTMILNIEPGAKINKVITKDGEMTYAEWYPLITTKEKFDTAMKLGGNLKLIHDIEVAKTIEQPATSHVVLDMDGKKLTVKDATADPMINQKTGSSLVITGNGTVDLEDNYYASFIAPRGDVTIENGTFLKNTGAAASEYGSFFVGINGGKGKLIIHDGYFDSGYYKEGDEFNNSRNGVNGSWGQYIRIYGGTFVGQNPAYGDEGMAYTNPNSTSTYCQALFFEGQSRLDTELPAAYKVEKGTLADGRPTYKVIYTPAE